MPGNAPKDGIAWRENIYNCDSSGAVEATLCPPCQARASLCGGVAAAALALARRRKERVYPKLPRSVLSSCCACSQCWRPVGRGVARQSCPAGTFGVVRTPAKPSAQGWQAPATAAIAEQLQATLLPQLDACSELTFLLTTCEPFCCGVCALPGLSAEGPSPKRNKQKRYRRTAPATKAQGCLPLQRLVLRTRQSCLAQQAKPCAGSHGGRLVETRGAQGALQMTRWRCLGCAIGRLAPGSNQCVADRRLRRNSGASQSHLRSVKDGGSSLSECSQVPRCFQDVRCPYPQAGC